MTLTRKLIIAFWIFIVAMAIWEFYNYNAGLNQKAIEHPTQQHFFFLPPTDKSQAPTTQKHADGADVQQITFAVEKDSPSAGRFTCHVTLKNEGNAKAIGIQINVRPYRGVSSYDEDAGHQKVVVLQDDNPLSKMGEFLSFPDLEPGQSATEDVSFISRSDFRPGTNPKPEIIFQTEKAAAPANGPTPHTPPPPPGTHKPAD